MQGNKSNTKKLLCTQKEGMGTSGENEVKPDYIFKKLVLELPRKNPSIKSNKKKSETL